MLLEPATAWLCRSTPTTLNWFVPGLRGTRAVHVVKELQVNGNSTPLNHTVLTCSGAVPLITATSLLRTSEFIAKGMLLTPWFANVVRIELCIVPIQLFSPAPPESATCSP